ncbi:MAG TPA: hypothetical protein PKA03_06785 [Tabrizicola sp.]|nr:hypothetical protein [Tabrizicola sp.]
MSARHYQSANRKSGGKPPFVIAQNKAIRLLDGTLARIKKPKKLAASLRKQLIGLARYWFVKRQRGESVIFPGVLKMQDWGECCERMAQNNVRAMEAWRILLPVAHQAGGAGNATEYVFSTAALWRVLVTMRANPSEKLRAALEACDDHFKKGAVFGSQITLDQSLTLGSLPQAIGPGAADEKSAEKGAAIAPRSSLDDRGSLEPAVAAAPCATDEPTTKDNAPRVDRACGEAGEVASDRPCDNPARLLNLREPPAGRSADASLFVHEEKFSRQATGGAALALEDRSNATAICDLSVDARDFLKLLASGPTTYGAAASRLGWGATRSSQAEAELLKAGFARYDERGRTVLCRPFTEPASPL